jgi:hypothetical protein
MAEPPELEELASRYLDLWREYMVQMAADPEFLAATTRLMAAFGPAAAAANPLAWMVGLPAMPSARGASPSDATNASDTAAAHGAAPAAAASDDLGAGLRELERRLAAIEKRLDKLESAAQAGGRRSRKTARKR